VAKLAPLRRSAPGWREGEGRGQAQELRQEVQRDSAICHAPTGPAEVGPPEGVEVGVQGRIIAAVVRFPLHRHRRTRKWPGCGGPPRRQEGVMTWRLQTARFPPRAPPCRALLALGPLGNPQPSPAPDPGLSSNAPSEPERFAEPLRCDPAQARPALEWVTKSASTQGEKMSNSTAQPGPDRHVVMRAGGVRASGADALKEGCGNGAAKDVRVVRCVALKESKMSRRR